MPFPTTAHPVVPGALYISGSLDNLQSNKHNLKDTRKVNSRNLEGKPRISSYNWNDVLESTG